ncbi:pyridoxal-phosphate dependent enzyme [Flammeovirgaceae bacterium SG7u.111]|nr:pyridoxal-phosphate dependent enzyme [Flammeovirgaceae bacterium SG7u.132]WPO37521.1 pyridoxal-phosphate dependent enzyme [Flammeovirgaceae bacterium SG7u.111]
MEVTINQTPIERVNDPELAPYGVELLVKRDDLIHPTVSGNKWRKLKYNISEARDKRFDTLLTFGGAFSNHIYATAAGGRLFRLNTIGIIRGEETKPLNNTLEFAISQGMKLHYMDREKYRKKTSPEVIAELKERFGNFYLVPEGGSNNLAVRGVAEIIPEIDQGFDCICTAVGTGGTLAGLVAGLGGKKKVLGIASLKGADFLKEDVTQLIKDFNGQAYDNWSVNLDYHFGGYAKSTPELLAFMKKFERANKIPLEFIYTGKMMYAIYELIKNGYFKKGETVLALHTGGIR